MALVAPAETLAGPTWDNYYINAAAADMTWEALGAVFDARAPMRPTVRRRQQVPGLNLSPNNMDPDSSFVMLGMAHTLNQGLEPSKTFSYELWTGKTQALAQAVRVRAQALMDAQTEPDRLLTYIIKVIDWALHGKAYLGMLQGWMLITAADHKSISLQAGSRLLQIAVPSGQALAADMNSCMQTFLHNTADALKHHGFEACGKQTQEATNSALTRLTLMWI